MIAASQQADHGKITSLRQCEQWALSGAKPRERFRIGSEYERLCIGPDGRLLAYDGEVSIRALLEGLTDRYGWVQQYEDGRPIALTRDNASITLEPAGQLELSGAPLQHVTEMAAERDLHLAELASVAAPLGVRFAYVGLNPLDTATTAAKMPKRRYHHMRRWMPKVGSFGLDMMHLTCTVQVNIDFRDETEAMQSFRLGYLMTPVLIALFANSPWRHGQDTSMASMRAHIWTDVDAQRCEPGDWVFRKDARVADYVRWAAAVPMYFLEVAGDDGAKILHTLPSGFSFNDFIADGFKGHVATLKHWESHVGTLFPDVRLKKHLEIRAADCVPPRLLAALPAIAKGVFYDDDARTAALALLADGDPTIDRDELRAQACRFGLEGRASGLQLRELSIELLHIARDGLGRLIAQGEEHVGADAHLDELDAIADGRSTPLHQQVDAQMRANESLLAIAQ